MLRVRVCPTHMDEFLGQNFPGLSWTCDKSSFLSFLWSLTIRIGQRPKIVKNGWFYAKIHHKNFPDIFSLVIKLRILEIMLPVGN